MTDAQRRRLVFGIIASLIGAITLLIALQSIERSASGTMLAPSAIGVILLGVGVYLLIRFFQHRRA